MRTTLLAPSDPVFSGNVTIGGTLTVTGVALFADGVVGAPGIAYSASATEGFWRSSAGAIYVTQSSVTNVGLTSSGIFLTTGGAIAWSGTVQASGTKELFLVKDAAAVLAQRNGANNQTFRLYGTFTDLQNYERMNWGSTGTAFTFFTQAAGTGTVRPLQFGIAGALQWEIDASTGAFRPVADNARAFGDATHRVTNIATYAISIREGANATQGVVTLSGGTGTAIVYTTALAAGSRIWLTHQNSGGTAGFVKVSTSVSTVSFTIVSSSSSDTSVIAWRITGAT